MTLWRLEFLRLTRTHRWMILFGVYAFFGVLGPLTARYMNEIFARFGTGEMTIIAPEPRPVDGIGQFIANAGQLGLLAVVVVAAGALAVDARPEIAAFLRTRVPAARRLLVPRYAVMTAAAAGALAVGTALAWGLTRALLGALPAVQMLVGTLYGALYLAFAVAVLAAVAGFTRTQAMAILGALVVLLSLPVLGLVGTLAPWLPSELLGAVGAMVEGAPARDFLRAALVTAAATGGLLLLAARRLEQREL